jgi:pyruvate/2-oxoglutarate dehydrogenase complex dihydrolipoamide dehydrogenase (E3) component
MTEFDAIIIGAGQSGVPLSKTLAKAGWKTALIEKRLVGGTCINDGCTPTKTMVASARMAYLASKSDTLGVDIPSFQVDFKQVMARQNEVVKEFREGSISGIEKTENLTLIYGDARFTENKVVEVQGSNGKETYTAKHIFINTGGSPVVPEIDGLTDVGYLTSTSILELTELPAHLLVIGAGYIALEFAQMFRRFGSRVTILERSDRLMPKEDDDVCAALTEILEQEGITILRYTSAVKFEKEGDNAILVSTETEQSDPATQSDTPGKVSCSHVLVAIGRKPQTTTLGLENTEVTCDDHGHIQVDEFLMTQAKNVYAMGDVNGGPAFTHVSYNDFVIVSKNLLEGASLTTKGRQVPYCMFTDPQLGRIGMTEKEATKQGIEFLVAKIPMANVARAIESSETRGFMKAIVDKNTKQILGVSMLGEQGGETMTILQLAITAKMTSDELAYMMFAHPLYAESINNLFTSID